MSCSCETRHSVHVYVRKNAESARHADTSAESWLARRGNGLLLSFPPHFPLSSSSVWVAVVVLKKSLRTPTHETGRAHMRACVCVRRVRGFASVRLSVTMTKHSSALTKFLHFITHTHTHRPFICSLPVRPSCNSTHMHTLKHIYIRWHSSSRWSKYQQQAIVFPPSCCLGNAWRIFLCGHDNWWCTSGVVGGFLFRHWAGGRACVVACVCLWMEM